MTYIEKLCCNAKEASKELSCLNTALKNNALLDLASLLEERREEIKEANSIDLSNAKDKSITKAMYKRLELTDSKIDQMIDGVKQIAGLKDPVGETIQGYVRPNGLEVRKVRTPLGVIGIIYESRPNVTVDVAALCLKSGNAVVLRGGSESINSNTYLVKLIRESFVRSGIPENAVNIVETTDREAVSELLRQKKYVDVIIPRGGKGLIRNCVENSSIPVIEHGDGNCHIYVDKFADTEKAVKIAVNAKVQNPSVCNACECLLVHKDIAETFLPRIVDEFVKNGVEIRGCEKVCEMFDSVIPATEEDWSSEYNDLIISVKIADSFDEAVRHIQCYGSGHSEAIVSENTVFVNEFKNRVDASCIFINTSTRFNDGYELGKGAEMGISTQKLHARGPMGLEEITTFKYIVEGDGQVRG
ncbi:MAG: glutamate-5-semialdehyde dehydrogenase [Armatimonadetes bacterium]|nr:glutamate-5-semialdehyde dehydrogenase [Candidatus Hippobium faecium]